MKNSGTLTVTARGDREIVMTRVFDAPRSLVFDALTRPELVQRWLLGPPGWSMPVCEIDLRVGGSYRYVWRHDNGAEMGMRGVYREVVPPERLVSTESFDEPWYPGEAVGTTVLVEQDGRTTLTITLLYESREARDGILKSNMEQGVAASYDRLAEVLASLLVRGDSQGGATGRYASVNGLELYYEVHGTGEPLMLLHGGVGAIEMFAPVLPILAQGRQVIAVDLQAHGRTADIDRPLRYELMAEDIAALMKDLGIDRADLMGYSLGGGVALRTAIQHPQRVRKLVLISIPFKREGWYPEVLDAMARMGPEAAEGMKQSPWFQLYPNVDWPALFSKLGDLLRKDYDLSKEVAAIKVPTMIVFADADAVRPAHVMEFYRLLGGGQKDAGWDGSGRPTAQLAILPGYTHYNILSCPALATVVIPFLEEPL
jgi:pimeloyl-ACP methyl ester carboxylesterase/uncharacterized protein YndB with AHSA1/START domain